MPAHVAIIGAGISGLAAAIELQSREINVTVLEATERAGGPIRTERHDGFIIDAGPDSFLSTKPGGLALADRLGIEDQIIGTLADGGGTFIIHDGKMEPLPEGITMLVPTQFRQILESPLMSYAGKVRLLCDYVIPARSGDADESVASFMTRRVGREAFENLAEPLLSGIFAGDSERLGIQSTVPRLREAERRHGGLIRAALEARRSANSAAATPRRFTPFVSFQEGLGTLVEAAMQRIGMDSIAFNTRVTSIERRPDCYQLSTADGDIVEADGVVIAAPAYAAAELLSELAPVASTRLASIPYVSSATVSMAFQGQDIPVDRGGRGFVVPRVEGLDLTAATWSSRKFGGRAPDGSVLLRGFVGRAGSERPAFEPDDWIIETVRRDLARITGIQATPDFAEVYRWHNAMPQYHVDHKDLVGKIRSSVSGLRHFALIGAAYEGVGIPDCISSSTYAAARLAEELSSTH